MGNAQTWRDQVTQETGVKGWTPFTLLSTIDWVHSFPFDAMHLGKNLGNDLLNMMMGGPLFVKGLAGSLSNFGLWPSVAEDVKTQPWSWSPRALKEIQAWIKALSLPESWSTDYKNIGIPTKGKNAKGMKSHTHKSVFECGLFTVLADWRRGTFFYSPTFHPPTPP